VAYHFAAGYVPGWHADAALAREMVRYGAGISASHWVWHLRRLANPMIVGRYLGAEMVAVVAVAAQITTYLGFVLTGAYRVSTAAFSRVQQDADRLRAALRDGVTIQVIGVAGCLAAFALVADRIVPALLGPEWLPLVRIYPYIAASFLVMSIFSLHSSLLHVLGRNLQVTAYLLLHVTLLFAAAFVLVPRMGVIGFGVAEILATSAYALAHLYVSRALGSAWYGRAPLVCAATLPLLFFPLLHWPALVVSGAALLWLRPWTEVGRVLRGMRGAYAFEP
jgi:PST family polysaccharide transporter